MKKTIKIKEGDIKQIVANIIKESNGNLDEYMYLNPQTDDDTSGDVETEQGTVELTLAKSPTTGDVYVLKDAFSDAPEILGIISSTGEVRQAAE